MDSFTYNTFTFILSVLPSTLLVPVVRMRLLELSVELEPTLTLLTLMGQHLSIR